MSRNRCKFHNDKIYLHFCMHCPSLLRKTLLLNMRSFIQKLDKPLNWAHLNFQVFLFSSQMQLHNILKIENFSFMVICYTKVHCLPVLPSLSIWNHHFNFYISHFNKLYIQTNAPNFTIHSLWKTQFLRQMLLTLICNCVY